MSLKRFLVSISVAFLQSIQNVVFLVVTYYMFLFPSPFFRILIWTDCRFIRRCYIKCVFLLFYVLGQNDIRGHVTLNVVLLPSLFLCFKSVDFKFQFFFHVLSPNVVLDMSLTMWSCSLVCFSSMTIRSADSSSVQESPSRSPCNAFTLFSRSSFRSVIRLI